MRAAGLLVLLGTWLCGLQSVAAWARFGVSRAVHAAPRGALSPAAAAGYFEGAGSIAVQSRGLGLKLTVQKASDAGEPLPALREFAEQYKGGSLMPVSATSTGRRQLWRLMYTAAEPQRAVLQDLLPHLQVKRGQAEAALSMLALDSRTEKEAKLARGRLVTELNPKNLHDLPAVSADSISTAYVAGLVCSGAGTLAFHDGGIRITFGSKLLAPLFLEIWKNSPDFREKRRPFNNRGELSLASQEAYEFLTWILADLPQGDPRTEQACILCDIYENYSNPRWAPLSPESKQKRDQLVSRLKELKQV